jgi:hypothetical protein
MCCEKYLTTVGHSYCRRFAEIRIVVIPTDLISDFHMWKFDLAIPDIRALFALKLVLRKLELSLELVFAEINRVLGLRDGLGSGF